MEVKLSRSNKLIAIIYPWLSLYGGGEVFLEYCNNLLIKNFKVDLYYYRDSQKIHKKLRLNKKTNLIPVFSKNKFINYFCKRYMIFAQTYLIYHFNKINKKNYFKVYSASGEFFSKFNTLQYIHICIFSLNIFEYKNFGLTNPFKKIARFIAALVCRTLLGIHKKKFEKVETITNSKWSLERLTKTYHIKKKKVLYPTFKIPNYIKNSIISFKKRNNDFVVLGRVSEDKKIAEIINFFNKVKNKINNTKLHIIGPIDKSYLKKINHHIKDKKNIFFHGLVSLKKRDYILKNSKYGLNFFHSEHFGRATLEMQKLGMIVFGKNAGGVREILVNNLQKYENYDDLKEKFLRLHSNDNLIEKILTQNKKKFEFTFTDKQFKKSFISYFKK